MLTQRFLQDISTGVQTLRFVTALVVSASVTSAVAGPMAYQAITFDSPASAAPSAASPAESAEETQTSTRDDAGVSATSISVVQPGAKVAEPSTTQPTVPTTAPDAIASPRPDSTSTAPVTSATEPASPPSTAATTAATSSVPSTTAPPSTTALTTAPTAAAPTEAPATTAAVTGIGQFGPVACGDKVYELDDKRPGSCVSTTSTR